MRVWTLHPRYLDRQGLVAVWRETLLAQAVLLGRTRGYRHHPQLIRFRAHPRPAAAVATYLAGVQREATLRGYNFDAGRIEPPRTRRCIEETSGQLQYEWEHLRKKLAKRSPQVLATWERVTEPVPHPLFRIVQGEVRGWEKTAMPPEA